MQEFNTRITAVEQKCTRMDGDLKLLKDQVNGMDRGNLRIETLLSNTQSEIDRLRGELRRHTTNAAIHNFDGNKDGRYEPKGFQENDQPRRFMGSGSM